uniref:BPTI/Kunitz inhibitor domain-containing protein n=1 Tax=Chrysemys picta bellii TaxID=8478 RepID=A0A8C3HA71_CHRPI
GERPRICNLPAEPGPCQAYMTRYFYNSVTKKCEEFRYGGCQGNENRFASEVECLKTCGHMPGAAETRREAALARGAHTLARQREEG